MNYVPNEKPSVQLDYKIAFVGEAPGAEEDMEGRPFVGPSGRLLSALMNNADIMRSACLVGNVCQVRPPNNDLTSLSWNDVEIQGGLRQLREDLDEFDPHLCVLLGKTPLKAAGIVHSVTDFRGTVFKCREMNSPFLDRKCLATLHPAYVMRVYSEMPLFLFDLKRARSEGISKELSLPIRQHEVELTAGQICERLDAIQDGCLVSVDIEGGVQQGVTCVGISTHPSTGFIVNLLDFSLSEQERIFTSLARVLCSDSIPKVLQNSLYDNFVLSWLWKMPIRNVRHDTMLSGWEIYPELPKGLGTQASIWTREPYYKYQRKLDDKLTHYRYCCNDAAVTLEIALAHQNVLTPTARQHYEFNVQLLPALNYMELRGMRYDMTRATDRLAELTVEMNELQTRIDVAAGGPLNPNSPKQMTETLYQKLRFEPQYRKEHGRKTNKLTADVEAMLNLCKSYNDPILFDILKWRIMEGQRKQLGIACDKDQRVRCSYNLVGTDTGRMTCYESPTGSGSNLQTITKKLRDLFIADEGKFFFQCDLSGADGWTVAAHCKRLGDPTMFDDYMFSADLKPAKIIALMYEHGMEISKLARPDLLGMTREVDKDGWLYFTCKRVQHGTNYGLGKITMSTVILKDSWKLQGDPIYVTPKDCEKLQRLYLSGRYCGVVHWQDWVRRRLEKERSLPCASGHVRAFFGRPGDMETLKAALSHEPQANTTYATNLALHRLWYDPENRRPDGSLFIEPLHQVHDALCGQFPQDRAEWACAKLREYFNNPLQIAEQNVTIPFEGAYGRSWGELTHAI